METKKVKLKELKLWEDNPQEMSKQQFEALKDSIKRYGYLQPIIVNEDNEVVGGNHRLQAMKAVFGEDYDAEVVMVRLSKEEQQKLAIVLNNVHGDFNLDILKEILQDLSNKKIDISHLGFDEIDLKTLDIKYDIDFSADVEALKKIGETERMTQKHKVTCPKCGHTFDFEYKRQKGEKAFDNEIG